MVSWRELWRSPPLSTVHDIVTRAGGEVRVVSVVGTGTRFTVALPPAHGVPAAKAAPVRAAPAPVGAPTIVIVENDAQVRGTLHTVLAEAGYTARSARSPGELLAEAAGWKQPPDLVLTDVVMAEITGPELVRRLRGRFPSLRALFMSGYEEERLSERGVLAEGVHFISKPLEQGPLLEKIARVLASKNPGALGPGAVLPT